MISNQLQHVVVQQNPQQADGMAPSCPHCPLRTDIRKSPLVWDKVFISITITRDSSIQFNGCVGFGGKSNILTVTCGFVVMLMKEGSNSLSIIF